MNWFDVARESLRFRILDDSAYCEKRLDRIPSREEVDAAIAEGNFLDRTVEALIESLDPMESELWLALGEKEEE